MASAQELYGWLKPITPSCPAWLYLEQRGIPTETIAAHQERAPLSRGRHPRPAARRACAGGADPRCRYRRGDRIPAQLL